MNWSRGKFPLLLISHEERLLYFCKDALIQQFCVMLRDSGCAMPKELCYHFQAYPSVQAPGGIGVSGDVGEDRLVYPAEVTDGF